MSNHLRPVAPIAVVSQEVWRSIPGYEGYYEVSTLGRVRGLDRWITSSTGATYPIPMRVLKGVPKRRTGHLVVSLHRDGVARLSQVHRIVLEAFVGPCPPGMQGCHNNGISSDNRLSNLRWDTASSNNLDAVRHGTHRQTRKTHCHNGHEYTPENLLREVGGGRRCRICARRNGKESKARARARKRRAEPAKSWLWCPIAIAAAILSGLITAPHAKADGYLSSTEAAYVAANAQAVCLVIAEYPSANGALIIVQGVMADGFTADNSVDIVNASVQYACPEYWPLLQRIGREARASQGKGMAV